ncbi:hypothetical protein SAMN05216325_105165 [Nitrosomonas marina]|uniref:Uncharacterized protein n=1 Tax=Nitrosomonas marina TaxID=917 RepID=A0A1H8CWD2_9PROT|nr:hypothetical protein SAMN05216325_105165 [Nitrosomonas marina]
MRITRSFQIPLLPAGIGFNDGAMFAGHFLINIAIEQFKTKL